MKECECAQCGVSAPHLVWGFALLVRDGWALSRAANPPGAAERAWLCRVCARRADSATRGLGRPSAPKPARRANDPKQPLRVLLIDDHVLVLRSLARMLADCETVIRSNPRQALKLLQSGAQFDAIVSDVMMPSLSGPELYVHCYRHSPELGRRFVFASADPAAASELIARALTQIPGELSPALLSKPMSREALVAAVSAVATGTPHKSGTYELQGGSRLEGAPSADRNGLPNSDMVAGGSRRTRY